MLSKKKKIVILCSMIALLVITGVLNVFLNTNALAGGNTTTTGENAAVGNFFTTYRADRQSTYDQSIAYLNEMIVSASSSDDMVKQAEQKKLDMVDTMNKVIELEGLIKAQGYTDCVVTMTTDSLNCIVKTTEMDTLKAGKIIDALASATGRDSEGMRVIPIE